MSNSNSSFDATLERLSGDTDATRCAELPAVSTLHGVSPGRFDDQIRRNLFVRTDVDVSPIGFATLIDIVAKARKEAPVYGTGGVSTGKEVPASASTNNFNSARDALGLAPIEVEERVYSDYVALGGDVEGLLERRSIYDCRYPRTRNSAKLELASILAGASSARAAWAADQYRTDSETYEAAKAQDKLGAQWVDRYLTDERYRNSAALTRRDLHSIFMLLQHSGDTALMLKSLPWLADRMLEGRISRSNYALLVDRILVFEGKPQVYGTQGKDNNGKVVPYPIERPQDVDSRRTLMYLQPIEQYYKQLNG